MTAARDRSHRRMQAGETPGNRHICDIYRPDSGPGEVLRGVRRRPAPSVDAARNRARRVHPAAVTIHSFGTMRSTRSRTDHVHIYTYMYVM